MMTVFSVRGSRRATPKLQDILTTRITLAAVIMMTALQDRQAGGESQRSPSKLKDIFTTRITPKRQSLGHTEDSHLVFTVSFALTNSNPRRVPSIHPLERSLNGHQHHGSTEARHHRRDGSRRCPLAPTQARPTQSQAMVRREFAGQLVSFDFACLRPATKGRHVGIAGNSLCRALASEPTIKVTVLERKGEASPAPPTAPRALVRNNCSPGHVPPPHDPCPATASPIAPVCCCRGPPDADHPVPQTISTCAWAPRAP